MRRTVTILSLSLSLSLAACGARECPETSTTTPTPAVATSGSERHPTMREPTTAPESLSVTIEGLGEGGRLADAQVFQGFGCTGGNRSPAIAWSGAPEGTQSYAIVMHDPDAPTGVGFFHWIVLDLPASITRLEEGTVPEGAIQGHTDFGASGYGGACPPPGETHRYEITVYALDVPSAQLPAGATGALVRFALREHTLALGRAQATWSR